MTAASCHGCSCGQMLLSVGSPTAEAPSTHEIDACLVGWPAGLIRSKCVQAAQQASERLKSREERFGTGSAPERAMEEKRKQRAERFKQGEAGGNAFACKIAGDCYCIQCCQIALLHAVQAGHCKQGGCAGRVLSCYCMLSTDTGVVIAR